MLFIILSLSPVFAVLITHKSDFNINIYNEKPAKDYKLDKKNNTEDVINLALSLVEEDFCDEGIKAALAIAENNLKYSNDNSIQLNNINETEFDEEFCKKVRKLHKKLDADISFDSKNVYIPTASLSKGHTQTNEDYPYIKPVASPWDCENKEFVYGKEYPTGVSMRGIDYLCKDGMSFKEALKWYLPDFEVK